MKKLKCILVGFSFFMKYCFLYLRFCLKICVVCFFIIIDDLKKRLEILIVLFFFRVMRLKFFKGRNECVRVRF